MIVGKLLQRSIATAEHVRRRNVFTFTAERVREFFNRRIEHVRQRQRRQTVRICTAPDDVENNAAERGVPIVAVAVPRGWNDVHFDIAGLRRFAGELDDGVTKIRPGLAIQKAGMKYANDAAIGNTERITPQPLMPPNGLKQPFGRRAGVVQHGRTIRPPRRVKIVLLRAHKSLQSLRWFGKISL